MADAVKVEVPLELIGRERPSLRRQTEYQWDNPIGEGMFREVCPIKHRCDVVIKNPLEDQQGRMYGHRMNILEQAVWLGNPELRPYLAEIVDTTTEGGMIVEKCRILEDMHDLTLVAEGREFENAVPWCLQNDLHWGNIGLTLDNRWVVTDWAGYGRTTEEELLQQGEASYYFKALMHGESFADLLDQPDKVHIL